MRIAALAATIAITAVLTITALPVPAAAQSKPDSARVEATRRAADGRRLLAKKSYAEALAAFEQSYGLAPQAIVLAGIAECLDGLGKVVEAFESYERALTMSEAPLLPHERRRVEEALGDLRRRTSTLEVTLENGVGATVEIDGAVRGKAPLATPIRVAPGAHKVVVTAPGRPPFEQTTTVAAGESATVAARLAPDTKLGAFTVRVEARQGVPAPAAGDLHAIVEGLDVGPLPLRIHAQAGRYRVVAVAASSGALGEATDVQVAPGETADVVLAPPAAAPPSDGACSTSDDCEEGQRCSGGRCVASKRRVHREWAELGETCEVEPEDLPCKDGLACRKNVCVRQEDLPPSARHGIGLFWTPMFGLGGNASYPAPLHSIGIEGEIAASEWVRLHLSAGYANLNGWSGLRATPIAIGVPFRVFSKERTHVLVEPGVDPFTVTAVFADAGHAVLFGTGLWGRASIHHGPYFATLVPVGLQIDFAQVTGNSKTAAAEGETGLQYFLRFGFGSHF
jgi:hypothetical protein